MGRYTTNQIGIVERTKPPRPGMAEVLSEGQVLGRQRSRGAEERLRRDSAVGGVTLSGSRLVANVYRTMDNHHL